MFKVIKYVILMHFCPLKHLLQISVLSVYKMRKSSILAKMRIGPFVDNHLWGKHSYLDHHEFHILIKSSYLDHRNPVGLAFIL